MKPSVRANLEMMWHVALRLGGLRDRRSWGLFFNRNRLQGKTGGSRPARRLTFCKPPKSKQKSAFAWRRALLSHRLRGSCGLWCR
jgi:hypothetical protein